MHNTIRELWNAGRPVANGWLSIGNNFSAEIIAAQGYDAVTVDMQHGMMGFADAIGMLQAIRACGAAALARVPSLEAGIIGKMLDAGAVGIICPLIDTPEQAAQLVAACRYPPLGGRSFGPARAQVIHSNYWQEANASVICLAMIETQSGVDNLEAIARTPGLDGLYIGPSDLTVGLTNGALPPGFDRKEPEMVAAIRRIIDTAHAAGIKACLHNGSSDYAARAATEWGADLVTLLNDSRLLANAASDSVRQFRALTEG